MSGLFQTASFNNTGCTLLQLTPKIFTNLYSHLFILPISPNTHARNYQVTSAKGEILEVTVVTIFSTHYFRHRTF